MKTLKQVFLLLALTAGAISLFSFLPTAAASNVLDGSENVVAPLTGGETSLRGLILTIVNYFLSFLGLVAVIMVIYGGVTYVISAGNEEAVGNAKKIIMYAAIGIVIILLSFVMVNAVLGAGVGSDG